MRQREGLPGGRAGRHGDRISTFLLMEGLHRMGSVGWVSPQGAPPRACSPCAALHPISSFSCTPGGQQGSSGLHGRPPHTHSHQLAQRHCRDQSGGGTHPQTQAQQRARHRGTRVHTVSRVHPPPTTPVGSISQYLWSPYHRPPRRQTCTSALGLPLQVTTAWAT